MSLKLLKFSADWCGPCKTFAPILNEVLQERNDVELEEIDIDLDTDRSIEYKVRAVPTIVLIDENGKVIKRHSGVLGRNDLLKFMMI